LEEVDIGYNLDVALEQEGVGSSIGNSDFATKLEQLMGVWCKQIELVLTESEQMRKEADDIGPSAELDHWKQRMTKFNSLLTAISTRRVKLVYATLAENKSKLCPIWMDLDRRVSDVANEARDNVKYLSTLDQYLGPLQTSDPMGMKDLLPNLINSIRMIHTISRYYNTSERMTSLFVKVTNQMIKSCRAYIMQGSNGKVWDQEQDDLLERINGCVDLKNEYQAQFAKAKDKLADEANRIPGGQDKHFDFSENYIFGKLENFCHRLECIKKVIVTLRVLSKLKTLRVDGIDSILKNLEAFESNIKMRPGELDYKRADWDNGFKDFLASIGRLEADLQAFIKDWIEKPVPTTTVLEILAMFQPLSKDINLNMQEAYQDMLRRYLKQDLVVARGAYNKQKTDPPGPKNFPPVAARISWARSGSKISNEKSRKLS
jgi:dynein heavy chain